jgi:hypothetical protein
VISAVFGPPREGFVWAQSNSKRPRPLSGVRTCDSGLDFDLLFFYAQG